MGADQEGQNSIVVAPGANLALAPADLLSFRGPRYGLLQLETPLDTVTAAFIQAGR